MGQFTLWVESVSMASQAALYSGFFICVIVRNVCLNWFKSIEIKDNCSCNFHCQHDFYVHNGHVTIWNVDSLCEGFCVGLMMKLLLCAFWICPQDFDVSQVRLVHVSNDLQFHPQTNIMMWFFEFHPEFPFLECVWHVFCVIWMMWIFNFQNHAYPAHFRSYSINIIITSGQTVKFSYSIHL